MSTYYAAQFGIALSIVDSSADENVNNAVIKHDDLFNAMRKLKTNVFKSKTA